MGFFGTGGVVVEIEVVGVAVVRTERMRMVRRLWRYMVGNTLVSAGCGVESRWFRRMCDSLVECLRKMLEE